MKGARRNFLQKKEIMLSVMLFIKFVAFKKAVFVERFNQWPCSKQPELCFISVRSDLDFFVLDLILYSSCLSLTKEKVLTLIYNIRRPWSKLIENSFVIGSGQRLRSFEKSANIQQSLIKQETISLLLTF